MSRVLYVYILCCLLAPLTAVSQTVEAPTIPGYTYHPPGEDKMSWQRLYLWLSSSFLVVAKEGQADNDSCIYAASRSMGLSRFSILAEGVGDPVLFKQSNWIDQLAPAEGVHQLSGATGKQRLKLLMLLGAYYAFEPHSSKPHRDSAEYYLTKARNESKSLKESRLARQALCLLGKLYVQLNEKRSDSICALLMNECRQSGDKETEARMFVYRGMYMPPMPSTMATKLSDLEKAAQLFHELGDKEGEINALTDFGYLQIVTGQLDAAHETMLRAFQLAEYIKFPYTQYNTQALITVGVFQGKFGEPLRYTFQTIRTAEATRDSIVWAYVYTNMSYLLSTEGREKECAEWAQKSVNRFVADRNTSVYNILSSVINYMKTEGRAKEALALTQDIARKVGIPTNTSERFFYYYAFSACYLNLGMLEEAARDINKLESLERDAEKFRGPFRRGIIDELRAHLYMRRKQYREARALFDKQFTSHGLDARSLNSTLTSYYWVIHIDSILGDNEAAVAHYKRYTQLLDSSFKVTKIRQAEELQVTYQINEKENQIMSLTQQARLEKANLEKTALVRNLMIAGVFATMIIARLLYRQNRLKQRNSQLITEKNHQLQQLLADKEWLLREIHHRVKNNLQIVMSLLDSQSEYINNDAALAAIEDNMRRVHAMALIHQKLYQSDDIATINMPEYISELVSYAHDSFDTSNRIRFEQNVEPLELDISQAIPLGLIINESIVNAIKYAFPDRRRGLVRIQFYQDGPDHLVLKISDNGVGLPPGLNTKAHTSLGLDLMQGLARQLRGSFHFENSNGLHITIRFIVLTNHFSHQPLANA